MSTKTILYEVDSRFNGKVKFAWQTCGTSVPTSKYLPIRAGTSTGNTRFEVVPLNGNVQGQDISKYKIPNYKMLFYIYVIERITVLKMIVMFKYKNNISVQLNHNEIKSINVNEDASMTKSTDGSKLNTVKLKTIYKVERTKLLIEMLNGWNQIGFSSIRWKSFNLFFIANSRFIKHRSFIPWNTTLPNACAMQDQNVLRNPNKVNHFKLNMGFTYGQNYGLNTVISCFNEIASENNVNITIGGRYTLNYTIAKFEVQGERSAKIIFIDY